ncbi:MAG: hypothetical protein QF760_01615 [Candidatus Thalassarchaeaceae archaeon]|jgi:hypothetical protein|nr:hypothetical protein [Candidatus Thalassarchaeaceae archaeon]MDP6703210.1 hypothetical protein [Candidatus Thalassarchaeaceae archaeon]MDP7003981.1 hypothetical protein [Candidatus Thalassarchaeaceae archaeon]
MTVNSPRQDDGSDLEGRLADIPRSRLIEEVISRWSDIIRLEGDVAALRRRLREAELLAQSASDPDLPLHGELEERARVADTRIALLERRLENERVRREANEIEAGRVEELREENMRLLGNEEELLLLILDMEAQIDRLSAT